MEPEVAFKNYPSIENSTQTKFLNKIKERFTDPSILWVASEKIHGANFSVYCDGKIAKYGRRKDFISKDVPLHVDNLDEYFIEPFYNANRLVARFHKNLANIFQALQASFKEMTAYTLYGQYFGGYWVAHPDKKKKQKKKVVKPESPGEKPTTENTKPEDKEALEEDEEMAPENTAKTADTTNEVGDVQPKKEEKAVANTLQVVQRGIKYTPNHQYFVFDCHVKGQEFNQWVKATELEQFIGKYIPTVPIYKRGTFEEVFQVGINMDSTIPQLLGLPRLDNNLIEGMVIRPDQSFYIGNSRVILKKKNAEFQEKNNAEEEKQRKAQKEEKKNKGVQVQPPASLESLLIYLNDNRIESAISKHPGFKNPLQLVQEIVDDIVTDAEKDELPIPTQEQRQDLLRSLEKEVLRAVELYLGTKK